MGNIDNNLRRRKKRNNDNSFFNLKQTFLNNRKKKQDLKKGLTHENYNLTLFDSNREKNTTSTKNNFLHSKNQKNNKNQKNIFGLKKKVKLSVNIESANNKSVDINQIWKNLKCNNTKDKGSSK